MQCRSFIPFLFIVPSACSPLAAVTSKTAEAPDAVDPKTTSISPEFVRTVNFAVRHGFGDPRGGEYREAKVKIGNVWNGGGEVDTVRGWAKKDGTFVTWDGVTHRPISLGQKIALSSEKPPDGRSTMIYGRGGFGYEPMGGPAAPALLLLAGETKKAEACWARKDENGKSDPGYGLLNTFLRRRFDQAVTAHMRGDDADALPVAKDLAANLDAYETFIRENGGLGATSTSQNGPPLRFSFAQPSSVLAEDSERRLKLPAPKPDLPAILAKPTPERIAALIEALETVDQRQDGQPGGVSLGSHPIVEALAGQGVEAVPAILDCMEKDGRLTRSVSFPRDFFPTRNLITVKSAAFAAFQAIYQTSEFRDEDGKLPSVAELRDFYEKMGTKTPEEVQFERLADDGAGARVWGEAASRLTERTSIRHSGNWVTEPAAGDRSPMKGEPLRSRTNPSLSDLMAKRVQEMAKGDWLQRSLAGPLAVRLAKWDPKAALEPLRALTGAADTKAEIAMGNAPQGYGLAWAWRIHLEDPAGAKAAVAEYGEVLRSFREEYLRSNEEMLIPLWAIQGRADIDALATRIFEGPLSPKKADGYSLIQFGRSGLIRSRPFRRALIEALADASDAGTVKIEKDGTVSHQHRTGSSSRFNAEDKTELPKPGTVLRVRASDVLAEQLGYSAELPKLRMYWSRERKDRAIAEIVKVLKREEAPKSRQPSYLDLPG